MSKPLFSNNGAPSFILIVISILIVAIVVGGVVLHSFLVDLIYNEYQTSRIDASEAVKSSLQHALMVNDFDEVQQIVYGNGYQGGFDVVRIINLKGVVIASSIPEEIGVFLKVDSEQCRHCHFAAAGAVPTINRLKALNHDDEVLVTAVTLENRVACQSCHGEENKYLGVILAEHPISPLDDYVAKVDLGLIVAGGFIFVVLSGSIFLTYRHQIALPIQRLVSGDAEDLSGVSNGFGRLATQLVEKSEELKAQSALLDFQSRSFNALLSISETVGGDPSVKKVFQCALEALREATDFVSIGMRLYDKDAKCFKLIAHYGVTPSMLRVLECIPEDKGFQAEALRTKCPVYTSDIASASNLVGRVALDVDYRSLICVPLIAGDQVLGTMELVTDKEHKWNENEVRWLALYGRSIGILIRNAQLSERLKDFTVLQERARLAQEIHDGLAQLIGSLRLWAEDAALSLEKSDLDAVRIAHSKIENAARDAYASIREEMLGLRDTVTSKGDITSVIAEYLSRFQRQWGIETKLFYKDRRVNKVSIPISPTVEIQLLRIFQEGLTNVRRHAAATRIEVTVEEDEDHLCVDIRDNGKGFDPDDVSGESLGIRIMRERAASIGGEIQIASQAGCGTVLAINVPKQPQL